MLPIRPAPSNRRLVLNAIQRVAEFELERVMSLRVQVHTQFETNLSELSEWAKQFAGESDMEDLAGDTYTELEGILELADQMLVVALYRLVELSTRRILGWRWGPELVEKRALYKSDELRKLVKSELNLDVQSLFGFQAIDELRCLNNAIKHDGKVTKPLAQFAGWTFGQQIGTCDAALLRISRSVAPYLKALADVAVPR